MKLLLCVFAMLISSTVWAAFVKNLPQTLKQPNGAVVNAFASGDENYNWVHDANGFTIVKNPRTNYYVYATKVDGALVPTNYVVGVDNPASVGLTPNLLDDKNVIDSKVAKVKSSRVASKGNARTAAVSSVRQAVGNYNNIVVYIQFNDQTSTNKTRQEVENIFNGANNVSVKDFYTQVSGGQLNFNSTFYPASTGTYPVFYTDPNPRSYYVGDNVWDRGQLLLKNAVNSIASQVPAGLNIDGNNDGFVDNVTFVFNGQTEGWASFLWPHRSSMGQAATINGKQTSDYNTVFTEGIGAGVIAHEMFHSFGAPDLYTYNNWAGITPIGDWDLMASGDWGTPRHMTVYMKSRYGTWTTIPEITATGTYTLQPVSTSPFSAFKIKLPNSTVNEYLVVEYRKKEGKYETALSGQDGLLVYKVNEAAWNAGGPDFEVYAYRPNGSKTNEGDLNAATLNNAYGRTVFNDLSNPAAVLNDFTTPAGLANLGISNVNVGASSLTFTFKKPCYNAYNPATAYNGGTKVSYNNIEYTAKWWTQNNQPDLNSGDGKPWTQTGTCGVDNTVPTVAVTSPTEGQVLTLAAGQKVNFTVSTTPSVVDSVKYILVDVVCNGPGCTTVRRFTQTTAPYSLSVDPIAGAVSSQVNVVAFKNGRASDVTAAVNYSVVQAVKPVVTINSPVENQEQYFYPSDNNKVNVALGFNVAPSTIDSVRLVVVELLCNGPGCANVRKYTLTNATTFNLSYLPSLRNNGYTEMYAVAFSKGLVSDEVKRIFYAKPLPELTIVSPANNSSVSRSISSLLIDVNVNTTNLAIDSVIYLVSDAVVNGQFGSTTERKFVVTSGSFDLTLPILTGKTFTRITALAFGDGGKNSRAVSTQVNYNDAPVVTITAPTVGSKFTVGGSVTVSANVTDDGNVSQVEIYSPHIPNSTVTLTAAPYTATFTNLASSGNRFLTTFIVKATDNQGAVTVQTIDVAENRLPVIAVTAPLVVNGINPKYKVGYPVTVSANVSDQDGTIKKVVFTLPKTGETIVDSILPYSVTFANLPAPYADGTLYFTVTAFDNNNATSATNVIVYKNRVPSATITSPVANATFNTNANITVTALPYDPDFTSGKIEYFVNGSSKIGEQIINSVLTAGTQYSVNFNNVPNGIYDFTARITDDMGEYAYSPAVRVEVKTPTVTCTAPVYNAATAYNGGQSVQYNGIKYTANWWTQGAQPDLNNGAVGTGKPWTSNGTCTTRTGDNVVIASVTSIYPNPNQGTFTIETETEATAVILNAFGKEVATLSLVKGQNEVNLSLSSGIYFVKINNNVTKLVIE